MKILCLHKSGGEYFRLLGLAHVFVMAGHEFRMWQPEKKPTFDAFDEMGDIDLFIGTTFDLTGAMKKCIAERPNMKVVLKGSNFGPTDNVIRQRGYPVVIATDDEKYHLERLKMETGKPDFVMCHYHPNRVEETMSGWRSLGIEPIGIMNAADVIDYRMGTYREELASDIAFVGGYWGYKSQTLNKYILPLCYKNEYNIKLFGNQKWPVAQYLGAISTPMVKDVFVSAQVCVNVHEPHSQEFGFDVIERPFKIISAGGFCISDYVDSLANDVFTQSEIPYFQDLNQLEYLLNYFTLYPNERNQYMKRAYKTVMSGHTYFHRVAYLLEKLGMAEEVIRIMGIYHDRFAHC